MAAFRAAGELSTGCDDDALARVSSSHVGDLRNYRLLQVSSAQLLA